MLGPRLLLRPRRELELELGRAASVSGIDSKFSVPRGCSTAVESAGLFMLGRYRRIRPESPAGMFYFITIVTSCVLVFALPRKTPGLNPAHILTFLTVLSVAIGTFIRFRDVRWRHFVEAIALSASLFFSLVPAINETLTRLPADAPFAKLPKDPVVLNALGVLVVLFVVLLVFQIIALRTAEKQTIAEKVQ